MEDVCQGHQVLINTVKLNGAGVTSCSYDAIWHGQHRLEHRLLRFPSLRLSMVSGRSISIRH